MNLKRITTAMAALVFMASAFFGQAALAEGTSPIPVYDQAAYTQYVESTMKKMNKLYLQFCGTCGVSGAKAAQARKEYYLLARDLMQHMNAKFDNLDPKKGAALSPTEVLVNIHALTMLVDMLTATQMEFLAAGERIPSE